MIKLKQVLLRQLLVIMAIAPMLFAAGKALASPNPLGIKNAIYASNLDCVGATASALQANAFLCTHYGKIEGNIQTLVTGSRYLMKFRTYDEFGTPGALVDVYVGRSLAYPNDPSLGSGLWVNQNMSYTPSLNYVFKILDDSKNKMVAIVVEKKPPAYLGDNEFFLKAASAWGLHFPWANPNGADEGDSESPDDEAALMRYSTIRFGAERKVNTQHLLENASNELNIDWSSKSIVKAERIRQKKYYMNHKTYGWMWVTSWEVENIATTVKTSGAQPADYFVTADELTPIANTSQNQAACTSTTPCYSSLGVVVISVSDGNKYYIGSKKFTKAQLDSLGPDDSIPCPFAAWAMESSLPHMKRAINEQWKFKFSYVQGDNTVLGNFEVDPANPKKYLIGKAAARFTRYMDANDIEISEALPYQDKVTALIAGFVRYDVVHCNCIEIYEFN